MVLDEEPRGNSRRTRQDARRRELGLDRERAAGQPAGAKGVGVLVNAYWEPGKRVAFPDAVNETILRRFPAAPQRAAQRSLQRAGLVDPARAARLRVARAQARCGDQLAHRAGSHPARIGAGSPEARAAIRNDDREVGLLLDRLRELASPTRPNHRRVRPRLRPRRLRRRCHGRTDQGGAQGRSGFRRHGDREQRPDCRCTCATAIPSGSAPSCAFCSSSLGPA